VNPQQCRGRLGDARRPEQPDTGPGSQRDHLDVTDGLTEAPAQGHRRPHQRQGPGTDESAWGEAGDALQVRVNVGVRHRISITDAENCAACYQ
jgi:hypothetical protein